MIDSVFNDALYWFLMNNTLITLSVGSLSFIAMSIGITALLKKWGL